MEILPSIQEAATLAIASNCTELCLDPSLLFGSLESFHNCLMYPAVTDLYANNMLSPNHAKMADSLVIEKSQRGSPLLSGIIQNITSCLNDYGLASSDCEQNFMDTYLRQLGHSFTSIVVMEPLGTLPGPGSTQLGIHY